MAILSLLAASATIPIVYKFEKGVAQHYDIKVAYEGYLPLLGGQQGKVQVDLGVRVEGLAPSEPGSQRVASELVAFKLMFNGADFPAIGLANARSYFPKTTVSITPAGRVLTSDSPDIQVPVRLPGLDVKRFPDITYLPVEFPAEGIEKGKAWTFRKRFGDSDAVYTVTPTSISDDVVEMDLKATQEYKTLEDEARNLVRDPNDAASEVMTRLEASGKAVFDRRVGLIATATVEGVADSISTNLKSREKASRKLKTTLSIVRR